MIDRAPVGYLSPVHLSEGDRLLAQKMLTENSTEIFFEALGGIDLIIVLEAVRRQPEDFYDALETFRRLGFSENFCRILFDAYKQDFWFILFHEYAPVNFLYEEVSHTFSVF